MINLWVREQDKDLLSRVCECDLVGYDAGLLSGQLENAGLLAKIQKYFVLGKERILMQRESLIKTERLTKHFVRKGGGWIPKSSDYKYSFVKIIDCSNYQNGLVLTPHRSVVPNYVSEMETADPSNRFDVVILDGSDTEPFVTRVFSTYYGDNVRKKHDKDYSFFLYSTYIKAGL
ncbi:hypothetical protein HZB01_04615 [Candidatus Woesearchaeota archaeon]|nr:hypothetical protein [Candidatus Woesearchaeota archaeon]